MKHIRVVWKEEVAQKRKPLRYRQIKILPYGEGWVIEGVDDNNIYKTQDCANSAIDKALGGTGRLGEAKQRQQRDIIVIGKKSEPQQTA